MEWLFGNKSTSNNIPLNNLFPPLPTKSSVQSTQPESDSSSSVESELIKNNDIEKINDEKLSLSTPPVSSIPVVDTTSLSSSSIFIPRSWLSKTSTNNTSTTTATSIASSVKINPTTGTVENQSDLQTKSDGSASLPTAINEESDTNTGIIDDDYFSDEHEDDDEENDNSFYNSDSKTTYDDNISVSSVPISSTSSSSQTKGTSKSNQHYTRMHKEHADLLRILPLLTEAEQRGIAGIFAYILSTSLYTIESTLWSKSFYRDLCIYKLGVNENILAGFDPLVGINPKFDNFGSRIDSYNRSIRYNNNNYQQQTIRSSTSPNDPAENFIPFLDSLPTNPIIRYRILRDLQLLYVANGEYDARVRSVLRSLSHLLGIPWTKLGKCEDRIIQQLIKRSQENQDGNNETDNTNNSNNANTTTTPTESPSVLRSSAYHYTNPNTLTNTAVQTKVPTRNRITKAVKITTAVILAASALAITGGLAAPAILTGISTLAGAIGVYSVSTAVATAITFLHTTAGAAAMLSIFGITGAGLAGYRMSRRFGDLTIFRFECLSHENRMSNEGKEVLSVVRKLNNLSVSEKDDNVLKNDIDTDKKESTIGGGGLHVTICISGLVTQLPEPVIFPTTNKSTTNNNGNIFSWFTPTTNTNNNISTTSSTSTTVPKSLITSTSFFTNSDSPVKENDNVKLVSSKSSSPVPDNVNNVSSSTNIFPTNLFTFTTETIPDEYKNTPLPILRDTYESRDYVIPWGGYDNADKRLFGKPYTPITILKNYGTVSKNSKSISNTNNKSMMKSSTSLTSPWFSFTPLFTTKSTEGKADDLTTDTNTVDSFFITKADPKPIPTPSLEPPIPTKDDYTIKGWNITLFRWKTYEEGIEYIATESIQQSPGYNIMRDLYEQLLWIGSTTLGSKFNFPTSDDTEITGPLFYWIYNEDNTRIGWIGIGNIVSEANAESDDDENDNNNKVSEQSEYKAEVRLCIWKEKYWGHGYGNEALRALSYYILKDTSNAQTPKHPTKLVWRPHMLCTAGISIGEKVGYGVKSITSITKHQSTTYFMPPTIPTFTDDDLDSKSNLSIQTPANETSASSIIMKYFYMEIHSSSLILAKYRKPPVSSDDTVDTVGEKYTNEADTIIPDINVLETIDNATKAISTYGTVEAGDMQSGRGWLRMRIPYGEAYSLVYEPTLLYELGDGVMGFVRRFLTDRVIGYALAHTVLNSLLAAFTLPSYAMEITSLLDSPWAMAMNRSVTAGRALAHALLDGAHGHRPVTLIGWGMGARTVFKCCTELALEMEKHTNDTFQINQKLQNSMNDRDKKTEAAFDISKVDCPLNIQGKWTDYRLPYAWDFIPTAEEANYKEYNPDHPSSIKSESSSLGGWFVIPSFTSTSDKDSLSSKGTSAVPGPPRKRLSPLGIIQDVFLLGAPIRADPEPWLAVRKVVAGRVVNAYSRRDFVLRLAYRLNQFQWNVAGLRPIGAPFDPVEDLSREAATLPDPTPVVKAVLPSITLPLISPLFTPSITNTSSADTSLGKSSSSLSKTNDNGTNNISVDNLDLAIMKLTNQYIEDDDIKANQYTADNLKTSSQETSHSKKADVENESDEETVTRIASTTTASTVTETKPIPPRTDTVTTTTTERTFSGGREHGQWGSSLSPCFPTIAWWKGIENVDVTHIVPGHLDYRTRLDEILNYLGVEKSAT